MTESRTDALALTASTSDDTFVLREDEFRLLYDRTSRALWVYLYRLTRDAQAADDLLQDTYYRFLRTPGQYESEQHERGRGPEPCHGADLHGGPPASASVGRRTMPASSTGHPARSPDGL